MPVPILSPTAAAIAACAQHLRDGRLIGMPTETVYGLAADARNPDAVAAIYAAKGRPAHNPLIVHVADSAVAGRIAALPDGAARGLWPGPLTMVLPLSPGAGLAPAVTAGLDTVAIRVPGDPVAQRLLREFGGPVAAPSANPSGRMSPTRARDVAAELDGRIAAVLDGGDITRVGLESTIIRVDDDRVFILREGAVPAARIASAFELPVCFDTTPGAVSAPGQLGRHYAPGLPIRLNVEKKSDDSVLLGFGPVSGDLTLSLDGDVDEAAHVLFVRLREAEALARTRGVFRIDVAPVDRQGIGAAINDRLTRAAASG